MMSLFKESYTPEPEPILLIEMFDVKSWVKPVNLHVHNISHPHVFVLEKNAEGGVVLRYKRWSRDMEWKPVSDDPSKEVVILKPVSKMIL